VGVDWFETLTGFKETGYEDVRQRLAVEDGILTSRVNGASYATGKLEMVSLETLRNRIKLGDGAEGRLKVKIVTGDVRRMHQSLDNAGALFQVASQFNLLEMTSPSVSPEDGVTRYQSDHTQGPACAIAAGAATIYRNYFVPFPDGEGQTAQRQLDGLADIGSALSIALSVPVQKLWTMRNGYALATIPGLEAISRYLSDLLPDQMDSLRGRLSIGLQSDVEVTEAAGQHRPLVSQAFCSALPIAYSPISADHWGPLASLVLEAAYEATLSAAVLNTRRGASNRVFLTLLGGGAFGNRSSWIYAALQRGLALMKDYNLDVRLVSYGSPLPEMMVVTGDYK
jgi:hypothetical protein